MNPGASRSVARLSAARLRKTLRTPQSAFGSCTRGFSPADEPSGRAHREGESLQEVKVRTLQGEPRVLRIT